MSEATIPRPGGEFLLGGRRIARIGLGVMQLGERHGREPVAVDDAVALLHRAVELGVDHFDTAQFYGEGRANELLARAFAPYPDDIVLVSKVGADRSDGPRPLKTAQKPAELRASVEANLASLRAERIDVVNLRRADNPPGIIATGDQLVGLDDQLAELSALRDEGKIGAIGLSNVRLDQLEQALPVGISCVQNVYNLLERAHEPLLDLCARHGIGWAPYFPLGSAFPGYAKVTDRPEVVDAAAALGATPSQVGLAWLLQHSPVSLVIAGTSSIPHLEQNVAAGDVHLDEATMARLDALGTE